MKILVLNCGSSSIKYELFEDQDSLTKGLIERIGEKGSKIHTYKQGIQKMIKKLIESKRIKSLSEIRAVGHRVVHGGELSKSCVIDKGIIDIIKKYSPIAPLHNPVNLKGIIEMRKVLPKIPHIAVFDTAFHQTMPEISYLYAIPYEFYKKNKIRRYGFHGTSHSYVSQKAAEILGKEPGKLNIITCHLGAGCSMAAIKKGKVVDTSMGFTPLEGLVMGTRGGDIDPGVIIFLAQKLRMSPKEIDDVLNKKSGLLGISGISKDLRSVVKCARKRNARCKCAMRIFCYRIAKYIGSYSAVLGKLDAIVFTAGIGENADYVRKEVCDYLKILGIKLNDKKNKSTINGKEGVISSNNSRVKVLVVPTDEEKMIAMETKKLLGK